MTTGAWAIPLIKWGNLFQNELYFYYPLYDWVTRSEALDGSQFLRIESGEEDAWIVNTSYVLEATIRFITQEQWDTEWVPFLEWAKQKNQFRWYPDSTNLINSKILSYLVEPITTAPTIETDGTRTLRLVIRNSISSYENAENSIAEEQQTLVGVEPSGSYPTDGLVVLLDNSYQSWPWGEFNSTFDSRVWYDKSGNDFHFITSGSSQSYDFDYQEGFNIQPGGGFSSSLATSSAFNDFWPLNSPISNSLSIYFALQPLPNCCIGAEMNLFSMWEAPSSYKMAIGTNIRQPTSGTPVVIRGMTIEGALNWSGSNDGDLFHFTSNSSVGNPAVGQLGTGSAYPEQLVKWAVSSQSSIFKDATTSTAVNWTDMLSSANSQPGDPPTVGSNVWDNQSVPLRIAEKYTGKIRFLAIYNKLLSGAEEAELVMYMKNLRNYNPYV